MKKLKIHFPALLMASSLAFSACSSGESSSQEKIIVERDSLKTVAQNINERIAILNAQLADLDTTEQLPNVTVDTFMLKTFEHYFEVHGDVKVEKNAQVFPEANGVVEKILLSEGARVQKGQAILQLDPGPLGNNIKELENSLELATKMFNKQASLWEQNIGSEIQYLESKNQKESLEQKLASAQKQLAMYTVTAPFDGVIDEIVPKLGEMASPTMPVVRVMDLRKVYLEANVSEKYLNKISASSKVKIKFPDVAEELETSITRIGDYINPANRTFKVQIKVPNANLKLKPNLLAKIKIRDYYKEHAIVAPVSVIQQDRKGQNYFYSLKKDASDGFEVLKKVVEIGLVYENEILIETELDPKTVFVDKGARSVQAGDLVNVIK